MIFGRPVTRQEFDRLAIDAGVEPSDENFARTRDVSMRLSRSNPFDNLAQAFQRMGLAFEEAGRVLGSLAQTVGSRTVDVEDAMKKLQDAYARRPV